MYAFSLSFTVIRTREAKGMSEGERRKIGRLFLFIFIYLMDRRAHFLECTLSAPYFDFILFSLIRIRDNLEDYD